ncbi:MAG TPA: hypothetical protein VLL57_06825, partial [Candidatus Binataceae bacterium]|nr:hypothetical protein [Candidatus Binataceae bacterium]
HIVARAASSPFLDRCATISVTAAPSAGSGMRADARTSPIAPPISPRAASAFSNCESSASPLRAAGDEKRRQKQAVKAARWRKFIEILESKPGSLRCFGAHAPVNAEKILPPPK